MIGLYTKFRESWLVKEDILNKSLWLLLKWHESQLKLDGIKDNKGKELTICWRILAEEWSIPLCQLLKEVLTPTKA